MAEARRRAEAVWEGGLADGEGRVSAATSRAFGELPVSWKARTEDPEDRTSPEELLAAAHAGCFAMALSHALGEAGHPPERVVVAATCAFAPVEAGFAVTSMELGARVRASGLDRAAFDEAVRAAERGCPVSNALRGNVDLTVSAVLEQT